MAVANTIAEIRIMRFIVISPISWGQRLLFDTAQIGQTDHCDNPFRFEKTFRFRRKIASTFLISRKEYSEHGRLKTLGLRGKFAPQTNATRPHHDKAYDLPISASVAAALWRVLCS